VTSNKTKVKTVFDVTFYLIDLRVPIVGPPEAQGKMVSNSNGEGEVFE